MDITVELSFSEEMSVGNSTCADIQIVDDTILEPMETFTVMLMDPGSSNIVITTESSSATVTINEDGTDCKCYMYYVAFLSKALGTTSRSHGFNP